MPTREITIEVVQALAALALAADEPELPLHVTLDDVIGEDDEFDRNQTFLQVKAQHGENGASQRATPC